MASVTAQALAGGESIWSAKSRTLTKREKARLAALTASLGDKWARAQLEIEARLRSYFSSDVVAGWQVYAWAVDRFIDAHRVSAAAALQEVVRGQARLNPRTADAAARLLAYGEYAVPPKPVFKGDTLVEQNELALLAKKLQPHLNQYMKDLGGEHLRYSWRPLEKTLLQFEQAVSDQVVAAHATGYSTSYRDLIHDLIP